MTTTSIARHSSYLAKKKPKKNISNNGENIPNSHFHAAGEFEGDTLYTIVLVKKKRYKKINSKIINEVVNFFDGLLFSGNVLKK